MPCASMVSSVASAVDISAGFAAAGMGVFDIVFAGLSQAGDFADRSLLVQALALTKLDPHALFAPHTPIFCAGTAPRRQGRPCIAIALITAARFARTTSAIMCCYPAGAT